MHNGDYIGHLILNTRNNNCATFIMPDNEVVEIWFYKRMPLKLIIHELHKMTGTVFLEKENSKCHMLQVMPSMHCVMPRQFDYAYCEDQVFKITKFHPINYISLSINLESK